MKTKGIIKTSIVVIFILLLSSFAQVNFGVRASVGLNNPEFKTLDETFNVDMTSYSIGPSIEAMFLL